MATDDRAIWEQWEGESNRWFQRFNMFRLAGPGRTILSTFLDEWRRKSKNAGKGKSEEPKSPAGSWTAKGKEYQWFARANAWDQHLADTAEAEIESRWKSKIMGQVESLGRMSEFGRNDIRDFFKTSVRWTENPLPTDEILEEEERERIVKGETVIYTTYKVKRVVVNMDAFMNPELSFRVKEFTDSPKDGIGFKLHDAPAAISLIGKRTGAFENPEDIQAAESRAFNLPADVIAPSFFDAYRDIRDHKHTEYLFYGGRGSTKSSFISLVIVYILLNNPYIHVLATRQVGNTLRDSVYSQLVWAINELGLSDSFKCITSPLEITYLPTGQKIYFRGFDDVGKIKSIKPAFGYLGILWAEECDQMKSPEDVRKVEQSLRGGDKMYFFKSWNPPRSSQAWINKYIQVPKESQYKHTSNYTTVPREWLGEVFVNEAEHLQNVNPKAYENEYLGVVNGTGGQVFENVTLRKITDEEITQFDRVLHGLDFGFYPDPAHYSRVHYDAARLTLYIFGEVRRWKTSNRDLFNALVEYGYDPSNLLICDSAEPKSVADFVSYRAIARGAEKGPSSVLYSIKWLQSLKEIVIDNERCPYSATEFLEYEYERTKDGEIIMAFPDANNHAIDSVRYSTNLIWRRSGQ